MKRGEVWVAQLSPSRGAEVGKARPVLILQDDSLLQEHTETVIVLPLTSQARPEIQHLRLTIPARNRLLRESQVIIEKPMTLDRRRFEIGPLTTFTGEEMTAVERGLLTVMGMASYLTDL